MADVDVAASRGSKEPVTCDLCDQVVTDALAHLEVHLRVPEQNPVAEA